MEDKDNPLEAAKFYSRQSEEYRASAEAFSKKEAQWAKERMHDPPKPSGPSIAGVLFVAASKARDKALKEEARAAKEEARVAKAKARMRDRLTARPV